MSYLAKLMKKGVPSAMEALEYGVASYGFGYVQSRYREKASVKGIPADLLAGVGLKALSLVGDLSGKGGALMHHMDLVGNAGIGAFMHTLGAGHGAKHSGVSRLLVPASDVEKVKAMMPGKVTVLGAIPKAPKGDFLSSRELADLAR